MAQDCLTYLYSFELTVLSLEIPNSQTKLFTLLWRKGQKSTRSQQISSRNKLIHLNETLKLCLKLSRSRDGEYLPKPTTLSLMQGNEHDQVEFSSVRIDLADLLSNNKMEFVVSMFPEPCKLTCKLNFEFIMQLKHFRFGSQEIQESEEEVKTIEVINEVMNNFVNEQQKLILKKQVQDLNYLNQKLRTDREKLILKLRELQFQFKDKQKLILRQMRNSKSFFDQKIKVRETIYEQEIQKLVFISNEKIVESQQCLTKFQDQNDQLKNKLKTKQSQIVRLRDELIKAYNQKQQLQGINKIIQQDRNAKHQNNLDLIQKYEQKIKAIHEQSDKKASEYFELRESQKRELLTVQEEQRSTFVSEIKKLQIQNNEKIRNIEDLQRKLKILEQQMDKKNRTINRIQEMLNHRKDELLTHQFQNVEISHKLQSMLSQNKTIEQTLNHQMMIADKDRRQLAQTLLKLQSLTVTYKLQKQSFNQERESFKNAEAVYQDDISVLKDQLKRLEAELQDSHDKQINLSNEIDRLHIQSEKAKEMFEIETKMVQRHESDMQNLRSMLEDKQEQLIMKERQIEERNTEIDRLHIDIKKLAMAKEDVQSQIKKLEMINRTTEELYNNKVQRETDHITQFNEMNKKQHQNQLQLERLRSQMINKENYIDKLERRNGEMLARLKMKKKQGSQESDSFIFASHISGSVTPKEGNKISAIEFAHIKAQMQLFRKQNDKKQITINNLNRTLQEKANQIEELQERINKISQNKSKNDSKNIERELVQFSKKNQKILRMLARYEENLDGLMKDIFDILNQSGQSRSLTNKLCDDFQDLQQQINSIKQQSKKTYKHKKQDNSTNENFSFLQSQSRKLEVENEDLYAKLREKDQQIQNLKDQVNKNRKSIRVLRSESDFDDAPQQREKSRNRLQRFDEARQTFGPTKSLRKTDSMQYEQNVQNFKRQKLQKEIAMKQSQMMKSSQLMDVRMQTLNQQLKVKSLKQQQLSNELKDRIGRNKQLQDEVRVLKERDFSMQQQFRKLQHDLHTAQRQISQMHRNRQFDSKSNNSNQLAILNREISDLKERQNRLKLELQRTKQQYKDKYIRYSQHKDILSQLDRALKDKGKQIQGIRKQLNDVTQVKNKIELSNKSYEQELQEVKKKISKIHDNQSSLVDQKQSEIKALKRKINTFERQSEQLQSKIQSLQQKIKQITVESQRTSQEYNRRNINQLKEINSLKEQQEVINQQLKVTKKRNQELNKTNNENQERIVGMTKTHEELKRKIQKMIKQNEINQSQSDKFKYQIKRLGDQLKRQQLNAEQIQREKRSLQEEISQLNKTVENQNIQIRKITKQFQRTKHQVNQTESDFVSTNKNNRLQIQKVTEDKRKLQKETEDYLSQIKLLQSKINKKQQQHVDEVAHLNKVYGQKMSTALSQIETIRKAVREAEVQIADYQVENADLHQQVERLNSKISLIQEERQNLVVNFQRTLQDIEGKKQQIEQLKKQRFDLQLKNTRLLNDSQNNLEDNKKQQERIAKITQSNKTLIQNVDNLQSQLRTITSQYNQILSQFNSIQPYESKFKHLQKEFKLLQELNLEVENQLKHKQNCVYTKQDFQKYQESIKERYQKEMEFHTQKVAKQLGQNYQVKNQHIQSQIVELLNQCTSLRTDVQRLRQNNSQLSSENNYLGPFKKQAERLRQELIATQNLMKELQSQLSRLVQANQKSSANQQSLQKQVFELQNTMVSIKKQSSELQSLNSHLTDKQIRLQSKVSELESSNEQLYNKLLQQQFQNARLKENQIFERSNYQKKIQQLAQEQSGQLKNAQNIYIQKIHVYNNQMDKLKNILSELKYLVEEKTLTIEDLTNDNEELENQLIITKQEFQNYKLRTNQQKEVASLELFKMTTKLRQSEDQSTLKLRRMQEEVNRISQQLMIVSSGGANNNKFNSSRVSERDDDRISKRYEQRLKLKDKTIQQLKIQLMNLQASMFKMEEQRQVSGDNKLLQEQRSEINRLKIQLERYEGMGKSAPNSSQITHLNDQIQTLKKKLAKSKKTQQELSQKLQEVTLKYESLCAQMIYYRGLQSANKELKLKYEQICDQLRGSILERSVTSDAQHQIEILQNQKQDLEKQIENMHSTIIKLSGDRDTKYVNKSSLR